MTSTLTTPDVGDLSEVTTALARWQVDRAPMQLHPGDLGWHSRAGAERTAADLRVWSRDGRVVAVGLLDAPQLVRMAVDPALQDDPVVVGRVLADLVDPAHGVLDAGSAVVEARCGPLLTQGLLDRGWTPDEPWTPLHLDLAHPVPASGLRVDVVGAERAEEWSAVHWSAFRGTPMTDDDRHAMRERWRAMVASPPYAAARCLTGYDERGRAVAVAGVWSAGPGRPGLLEPIGTHAEHRGRGHGRAVTLAAAAVLRELGSSSAVVCTRSAKVGAVATYVSAGFERFPKSPDLRRG